MSTLALADLMANDRPEKPANKAQFVRTRPLDEPVKDVIAAGKRAGFHNMQSADVYMARKVMQNARALSRVRERLTGKESAEEPTEEAPEPPPSVPRRKRLAHVPEPGNVLHRVHEWLDTYVKGNNQGPATFELVANALGIELSAVRQYMVILRKRKVITYNGWNLRMLRVMRPPAKLYVPREERSSASPPPPESAPQVTPKLLPAPPPAEARPWPPPYLAHLEGDLAKLLGALIVEGRRDNLEAKAQVIEACIAILRGKE